MYKDVAKRILASILTFAMIGTTPDWTVLATQTGNEAVVSVETEAATETVIPEEATEITAEADTESVPAVVEETAEAQQEVAATEEVAEESTEENTEESVAEDAFVETVISEESAVDTEVVEAGETIDLSTCTVTFSPASATYNKSEQKPAITIKNEAGDTLTEDTDYSVEYEDEMTNAGLKAITITGMGNYTGTLNENYSIYQKYITSASVLEDIPIQLKDTIDSGNVEGFVFGFSKDDVLVKDTDYTLTLETDANGYNVKATISGINNYRGTKTIEIDDANPIIIGTDITEYTATFKSNVKYTYQGGAEIKPKKSEIQLTHKTTGDSNASFEIVEDGYKNNILARTYDAENPPTVTIVGTGTDEYALAGTLEVPFTIEKKDLSDVDGVNVSYDDVTYHKMTAEETGIETAFGISYMGENLVRDKDFTVSYSNNTAVTDSAVITVTGIGDNYTGTNSTSWTYKIKPADISTMTYAPASLSASTYTGSAITPEVEQGLTITQNGVTLEKDIDYTISYLDEEGATVSEMVEAGEYTVLITGKGNYDGSTKELPFEIKQASIADATVTLDTTRYAYEYPQTVEEQKALKEKFMNAITSVEVGGNVLTLGTDYTLAYTESFRTGNHSVTITGMGNYTGTTKGEFVIYRNLADLKDEGTITVDDVVYTGTQVTPKVRIKDNGSNVSTDEYTISSQYRFGEGIVEITITGKNNLYVGTCTLTANIVSGDISNADIQLADGVDLTFTGSAVEPDLVVKYGNTTLTKGTDYTVAYENAVNVGDTAKAVVTGVSGYFDGEKEITYSVTEKSLEDSSIEADGGEIDALKLAAGNYPDVNVIDINRAAGGSAVGGGLGSYKLIDGKDFEFGEPVLNDDGITGSIELTGINNYSGTITVTFIIHKIELEDGEVYAVLPADQQSFAYTGDYIIPKPKVAIMVDGAEEVLEYGVDYEIKTTAIDAGTGYHYTVIGKTYTINLYSEDTFAITARDLSDAAVTVDAIENQAYTGAEVTPAVTVRLGDTVLENGTDYTLSYADNVETGDKAKVIITAKSANFAGERTEYFSICPNIAEGITISAVEDSYEYAGPDGVAPYPLVKYQGKELTRYVDYDVEYENNVNAQSEDNKKPAIIRIIGKGAYGGIYEHEFTITPKAIFDNTALGLNGLAENMSMTIESAQFTGGTVYPKVTISYTYGKNADGSNKVYVLKSEGDASELDYTVSAAGSNNVGDNVSVTIYSAERNFTIGDGTTTFAYHNVEIIPKKLVKDDGSLEDDIKVSCPPSIKFEEGTTSYIPNIDVYDISRANTSTGEPQAPNANDCYELKANTDYTITFYNNSKPGTATYTITGKGNYQGIYTKGSFNIIADLNDVVVDMPPAYIYTGKPVQVQINKVSVGGVQLQEDFDYTYEVEGYGPTADPDNTDVGEYILRIIGKGGYAGSEKEIKFNIEPKSIEDPDVVMTNVFDSYSHTGENIHPEPWFEYNDMELIAGEDFVCTYEATCGEPGKFYTFTIDGTGNFTGTLEKKYYVGENFDVEITLSQYQYEYTGELHEPTVVVKHNEDGLLTAGVHYKYEIIKNRNAGTAYVNVWGIPNETDPNAGYGGNATKEFKITPKPIDEQIAISDVSDVTYNREEHTPEPKVVWNKTDGTTVELHVGTDFEYVYDNNINASTDENLAKVYIKGMNNFEGEKFVEFTIHKKNIEEVDSGVTVEDIASQIYSGTEVDPVPEVIWEEIALVEGEEFTLTYENNTELTTDSSKAKVSITGTGNYEGTIEREFAIVPIPVKDMIFEYKADHLYTGKEITPKVTMYYQYPAGNYASDKYPAGEKVWQDEKNFSVEYKHTKDAGEKDSSIITITGIEEHYSGSTQCYYTIAPRPLSDATIVMDKIPNQVIDEEAGAAKPMPTLTFRPDSTTTYTLIYGADYTVEWNNNTAPGMTGTIRVTGKGNFGGEKTDSFYIGKDIHQYIGDVKFAEKFDYIYNGKAQTPAIEVVNTTLVPNVDYEILYDGVKLEEIVDDSHATKAGIHKAAVAGIGEYGGIWELEYEIGKRDISKVEFTPAERVEYTGSPIYPFIVGNDTGANTRLGEDESTAESTGDVSVEGMLTNLNAFTTSYQGNHTDIGEVVVQITATENSNYYGTTTLKYNIEPKDLMSDEILSSTVERQDYTGSPIKPEMVIKDGGRNVTGTAFIDGTDIDYYTLVEGQDYDITYTDNIYPGLVTMTITGKNHYTGTLTKQFEIVADLSSAVIAPIPAQVYTGSPVTPDVKVTIGQKELKENFDYTVTYANNVERGTATVTISPVAGSMYTGSKTATFEIGREFTDTTTTIKMITDSFVYTGNEIRPKVAVVFGGVTLTEGVEYAVTYTNNINVGTATVTISALGTYEGSVSKNFTIVRRSITRCSFENVVNQLYTGKETTQSVVVKDGNRTLVENQDYTVTYANNIEPGAASVILTGIGNYASVKTVHYMINVRNMGKIKGKATSDKVIKISWEPIAGAQGYAIYNAKNDLVGRTTKTSFKHKKLKALKNYKYKVRPYVVSDGTTYYGKFSKTITVRTLAKAPTKVKAKAGDNQITISWKKVKGVSGYVVYRSTKKSGKYKKVATLKKASKTKYTNKKLKSGKRYYYKVRSYKTIKGKKIYSKYTSPKSAKTY